MRGSGGGERGSYTMADWWRMRIGCFSFHLSLQRKRLSQWGQCHQDGQCFHDNQEHSPPPTVFSWFVLSCCIGTRSLSAGGAGPARNANERGEECVLRPRRGAVLCLPSPVVAAPLVRSFSSTLMFYSAHIKLCLLIVTLLVLHQTPSARGKIIVCCVACAANVSHLCLTSWRKSKQSSCQWLIFSIQSWWKEKKEKEKKKALEILLLSDRAERAELTG